MQTLSDLLNAPAVRQRCTVIGNHAVAGDTRWFKLNQQNIQLCAEQVAELCRANYPDLTIPLHSRWRHFIIDDVDLWAYYRDRRLSHLSVADQCRVAMDLVFVSVLVDAGAGAEWKFTDPVTGAGLQRSEGLAAASIELFFNCIFDEASDTDYRLTAQRLDGLDHDKLSRAFQHSSDNPLLGIDGRLELLRRLARVLAEDPELARPADIMELAGNDDGAQPIAAGDLLSIILRKFSSIWPGGLVVGGRNIGDAGRHYLLNTNDETSGVVVFHKLSQWLTYSLIEPLQWNGFDVVESNDLTGLPEYRNGGMMIDMGVLEPYPTVPLGQPLDLHHEAVVEWRALTVWLLDQVGDSVRQYLDLTPQQLPLGSILQGGTWALGRKMAFQRRPGGEPPLKLAIDGTIF